MPIPTKIEKEKIYKIITDLKPGDTFTDILNRDKYKYHIVANLVEEEQVVFKYFGKRKQWWHFEIQSYFWFELRMRPEDSSIKLKIKK